MLLSSANLVEEYRSASKCIIEATGRSDAKNFGSVSSKIPTMNS